MPNARSSSAATPPSRSSHSSLVAEKYGSSTSPVRVRTIGSTPATRSSSQRAAVRRSCQTIARWRGRPVERSHTTTVSRWSVMPIAATVRSPRPRDHLGQRVVHRAPDLVGVVLDPARAGEVLRELPVGEPDRGAVGVDRDRAHAGRAGVDREDDGGHRACQRSASASARPSPWRRGRNSKTCVLSSASRASTCSRTPVAHAHQGQRLGRRPRRRCDPGASHHERRRPPARPRRSGALRTVDDDSATP